MTARLHTSALPKISHPVASDRDLILKSGVFPIHPSIPSTMAGGPDRATNASAGFLVAVDFVWRRSEESTSLQIRARPTPATKAVPIYMAEWSDMFCGRVALSLSQLKIDGRSMED